MNLFRYVHSLKIQMKVSYESSNRQGDHQNVYFIVTNRLNKLPFLIFSAGGWVVDSILSLTRSNNIQRMKEKKNTRVPHQTKWKVMVFSNCMHLCNIVTRISCALCVHISWNFMTLSNYMQLLSLAPMSSNWFLRKKKKSNSSILTFDGMT